MDARQALADLTEISSQIEAAVVFDEKGKVVASTLGESGPAAELARAAAELLAAAEEVRAGESPLTQLEVATRDGNVFIVRDAKARIAATTGSDPTVGLVFYDLKSALRNVELAPRRPAAKKPTTAKKSTTAAKKAPARKATPKKKKPDAS
jgi:predicted regulator of Ras-like GTPase activity (Roadblock/LC7/MglB family)